MNLPDSDAYDLLFAVQRPLLAHDRPAAAAALGRLRERFPDHRLAKFAVLALARYDAHPVKLIASYDALLADVPHDPTWVMAKASALRELNRLADRLALLEHEGSAINAEPLLMQSLAQMLLPLPHRQADADRLLRRSVRNRPTAAAGYYLLATQWWEHRQFEDAAEVYRFACTLDEREDQFADAYFRSARATEQVPEALRLFQQRAGRAAVPTPSATRALYQALMDRDEPQQAAAALDQAIRKLQETGDRPPAGNGSPTGTPAQHALGELLLFRAECHAGFAWHKAAARAARLRPDLAASADHYREVLKLDPLSADPHRSVVGLLAETAGRAAARTHLAQACQRFPHSYPLLKLRAEFLSGDPDADADAVLAGMIADCPEDAWALRQRALVLADRKRVDEAFVAVEDAGKLEPGHPWYYGVLVQVRRRADRTDEALTACREGLRANVDQEPLIAELVQLSRGREEKKDALAFVAGELRRQPHTGEGLVAFVAQSHQVFAEPPADPEEHEELLETLEEVLDDRPDLQPLFREYGDGLGVDLSFQHFDEEMKTLETHYEVIFVARDAGCVALRRIDDQTCEMKRLYIRPQFRGTGLGRNLALRVIDEARSRGYKRMRLDTLPSMQKAQQLYESLGFRDIESGIIDGAVVETATFTESTAGYGSFTQTGYFRNYVLVFVASAVVLALILLLRAA